MSGVWNLFLSSTVKDLGEYRRAVRDACRSKAETACFLSEEDWSGGYDDTVAKCGSRVREADAFLLLVGYWYGSIPPGCNRSITHIEFDNAIEKWGANQNPPFAVMMPAHGSLADKKLRAAASKIIAKDRIERTQHRQALDAFVQIVTGSWRIITRFKTKPDLREHAIARCLEWKGRSPMAAARREIVVEIPAPASQVNDEKLGALGRAEHFGAVRATMAKLADQPDIPAIALLAHGDDSAGQRAFLHRLIDTVLKRYYPRRGIAALPVQCAVGDLPSWIARSLGLAAGTAPQSPAQLAEHVARELKHQPLYFAFDRIDDLKGGVSAFRDGFWRPFYSALHALRATQQFTHRLVVLGSDYSERPATWEGATCDHRARGAAPDYTRLIRIPRLERFDRDDVLAWFDEMDVPDEPAGNRAALADRALRNSEGVPLRVFERLRGEALWPDLA
jgi:hypothetical protein